MVRKKRQELEQKLVLEEGESRTVKDGLYFWARVPVGPDGLQEIGNPVIQSAH
jgi:hypothetical protein